ncbi:MAG: hypothetical protein IPF78_01795 [Flavobacteriales bacterium]|nr:hypothetical protein [Flavobacteriales bacterium]
MKSSPLFVHLFFGALLCASTAGVQAQEAGKPELVTNTFSWSQVINAQSIEVVPRKRSFGFMIQHRFGAFGMDDQSYKQFFGLDLPANIRFGFQYAVSDRIHLEVGRSKNGKLVDLAVKARILRQTVDNTMPISVTGFFDAAVMTDAFPAVADNYYFADLTTPFVYEFKHRMSYNSQVIVGRRFNEVFSLQAAGAFEYRNLAPSGGENLTVAVPVSGRVKVSTKGAILFEYAPVVGGRQPVDHLDPVAIAYELATLGHVFQIIIASSGEIMEQRLYTAPQVRYDEGNMLLGFNISRTLFVKPKSPRP